MDNTYYYAFERFVTRMTALPDTTVEGLEGAADEICRVLRIAKLHVSLFRDRKHETIGKGNSISFFESGNPYGSEPLALRKNTEHFYIAIYEVFPVAGAAPWTVEECECINKLVDTLFIFNGRTRLLGFADRFTYYDDDNYHNLRYFFHLLDMQEQAGTLTQYSAFHFNLKHFSLVNQQIGRRAGSFVMHSFYDGLQELLGGDGWVCRIGGDNFAMLAKKHMTEPAVRYLLGTGIVYDPNRDDRIMVSACVGIFDIPANFRLENESDIMDRILSSSQAARNTPTTDVVVYNERIVESKKQILKIQRMFPEALANGEFIVYYQPKVSITDKKLAGAEALCRWRHNGRIVPPVDFIPILESGMEICELDFYVLDLVCKDIRRWLDEGRQVVRVSVNLSRRHMVDMDLLEHLIEIIDRNRVPHEYIEIELTETTTDVKFTDLKRVVNGLQKVGIYTSVDDFGMGYSSLNLLKEIPWDVLKVDRSFLPEDLEDTESRRSVMFRTVVEMAKAMGLECIAEGVETETQVELLARHHCDLAQGFFFDMPLPVEEYEQRMDTISYAP